MSETSDHAINDYSDELQPESEYITIDELKTYDIDTLLQKAGGFGRMQWWIMIFVLIGSQGFNCFIYNFAYLELVPLVLCKYSEDSQFVKCDNYKDICVEGKVYEWKVDYSDPYSFHNWMTDSNLYCNSDFSIGSFGSSYFLGLGFVGLVLKFSDNIGRKTLAHYLCVFQIPLIAVQLFCGEYRVYYVLLFLGGLCYAKEIVLYIYAVEMAPEKYQVYVAGYALSLVTVVCHLYVSFYFYFGGKSWKYGFGPCLIMTVLAFFCCFLAPESPRYLYSKKDWPALHRNLSMIGWVNGSDVFRSDRKAKFNINDRKLLLSEEGPTTAEPDSKEKEFSVMEALRNRKTKINFVCIILCFSLVSFNYFMIGFYLKYISGNIYINTIASTISDLLGNSGVAYIQKCFGTKNSFVICFVFSAVFAVPLFFLTESGQIAITVFISKLFCEGAFSLAYYVGPEYFDPLFVPFSFSMCSFCARFITITAPQVAEIKPREIPIFAYLLASGIAAISAMFLMKPDKNDATEVRIQDE